MSLPSPVPRKAGRNIIPEEELMLWIKENVDLSDVEIVNMIRDDHTFTKGEVERHRLDIFEQYFVEGEGEFCWTNRVGERSWYLYYNRETNTITDHTTGRYKDPKANKVSGLKKLDGIAKGSERIGKSFR